MVCDAVLNMTEPSAHTGKMDFLRHGLLNFYEEAIQELDTVIGELLVVMTNVTSTDWSSHLNRRVTGTLR